MSYGMIQRDMLPFFVISFSYKSFAVICTSRSAINSSLKVLLKGFATQPCGIFI